MMIRVACIASAAVGAAVGVFWLFAIDASLNGARWPPNWRGWPAYVSCPFIPLVGRSNLANLLVPILNGGAYALLVWGILRAKESKEKHG